MTKYTSLLFVQFAAASIMFSCSEREIGNDAENSGETCLEIEMSRSAENLNPENLIVVAYKSDGNGNFSFQNSTEYMNGSSVLTESDNGKWIWKNSKFLLPIGEYRLLMVYADTMENLDLDYPNDSKSYTWDELVEGFRISAPETAGLNVGEVFANSPETEVFFTGANNISVSLDRVNTRLDFEFVKIDAETGEEEPYESNNIFGGSLRSVSLAADVPYSWNWNGSEQSMAVRKWTDVNVDGSENSNVSVDSKGFAYYKGAYILPFVNSDAVLDNLEIELVSEDYDGRTVKYSIDGIPARKNHISLVNVQLMAHGEKDDDVNIFTGDTSMEVDMDVSVMDEWPEYNEDADGDDGFWNSMKIDTRSMDVENAEKQIFRVYVFKAAKIGNEKPQAVDDKLFFYESNSELMDFNELGNYKIIMNRDDMEGYHYKVVVTSTPADVQEITTNLVSEKNSGVPLSQMEFVRMKDEGTGNYIPLSKDNYMAVAYITEETMENRALEFEMRRLTGQLVFDMGRFSEKTGKVVPLDEGYDSVLDGVHKVKVEIIDHNEVLEYNLDGTTDDSRLPGSVQKDPWNYGVNSMVRLYGPFMFPDNSVQLRITYYYNQDVIPDDDVIMEESVVLNMPSAGKNIKVVADSYSVSTIKILENRIIDVMKVWGDVELDTEWN